MATTDVASVAWEATVDDLYRIDGKGELVGGRLVIKDGTGDWPSQAAGAVYSSLRAHARATGSGRLGGARQYLRA